MKTPKKHRLPIITGAAFLFFCFPLLLTACSGQGTQADAQTALEAALRKSLESDIYYWKETITHGKDVTYTAVNVLADVESSGTYDTIKDAVGNPRNLQVNIQEKKNNKLLFELWCGSSAGKNAADSAQDCCFEKHYGDTGVVTARKKTALTALEYIQSREFEPYTLREKLTELQGLSVQDMDFDAAKAGVKKNGIVTTLQFAVKAEYLERYARENGKPSQFANAKRVMVELTQSRVSNITVFVTDEVQANDKKSLLNVEAESYKLEIVYQGPNFSLPNYNEDTTNTNENLAWIDTN